MGGKLFGDRNPSKRPEVRKKISEGLKRYFASLSEEQRKNRCKTKTNTNVEHLREMGEHSRLHENTVASQLEGDHIFKPNEVCDRIVVKNGEVFFVEIKNPSYRRGKRLTSKQKLFRRIVGDKFHVVYS